MWDWPMAERMQNGAGEMKDQINYDRVSVLAASLLLAMALARFLEIPARPLLKATVLGSPLGFSLSATTLVYVIIFGLTITAIASILTSHPIAQQQEISHGYMYWVAPALLNVGLATWLNRIHDQRAWSAVLLICALLVPFALIVEYRSVDRKHLRSASLRRSQVALIHLAAGILFTLNYDARTRSLLSGTTIVLVAGLLSARLLWTYTDNLAPALLYGAIVGVIMGQVTWGLNYWRLSGVQGGVALLLLFYVLVGVVQSAVQGHFKDRANSRRILLEYAGVSIVTLVLILLAAP
jgi:hypothetical protein